MCGYSALLKDVRNKIYSISIRSTVRKVKKSEELRFYMAPNDEKKNGISSMVGFESWRELAITRNIFFLRSNLQLALADVNKILTFELFSKILHAKLGVLRV